MLLMCSIKIEYKNFVWCTKNEIILCHMKMIFFFLFWHLIIFLLLRDNRNISPWDNILNDVQNKNLVLHKKQFCAETSMALHKKLSGVDKNKLMLHEKLFHVNKKKIDVAQEKYFISTNKMMLHQKNILCLKKFFFRTGHHSYSFIKRTIDETYYASPSGSLDKIFIFIPNDFFLISIKNIYFPTESTSDNTRIWKLILV